MTIAPSKNKRIEFNIHFEPNKTSINDLNLKFSVSVVGSQGKKHLPIYSRTSARTDDTVEFIIDENKDEDFSHFKKGQNPILEVAKVTFEKGKPTESNPIGKIVLYDEDEVLNVTVKPPTKTTIKSPLKKQIVELKFKRNALTAFPALRNASINAFIE